MPHGAGNMLLRRAYRVPSEEVEVRILAMYRRCATYAHLASLAGVLVAIAVVATLSGALLRAWGPALMLVVLIGVTGPLLAFPRLVVRLSRPLEDLGWRDFGTVVGFHGTTRRAAITGWTLSAFVLFATYALVLFAYEHLREGRFVAAAFVIGIAAINLPILGVGPAVAKLRRQRAENERLEAVVRERTAELEDLNRTLEARAVEQVRDIERLGQLRRFFAAPVAAMILDGEAFDPANVHRRELSVVSMDLRGFTAFSETAGPEEVIAVLRTYHAELGLVVNRHQGTLEHFAGDGATVFLNDPLELPDHPRRALQLAVEFRDAMRPHLEEWRRMGFELGLGIGIGMGYATIGAVGYEGRWEYAAIGSVCHVADSLCSQARDGEIVTIHRVTSRAGEGLQLEPLGERTLRGLPRAVAAFNVVAVT